MREMRWRGRGNWVCSRSSSINYTIFLILHYCYYYYYYAWCLICPQQASCFMDTWVDLPPRCVLLRALDSHQSPTSLLGWVGQSPLAIHMVAPPKCPWGACPWASQRRAKLAHWQTTRRNKACWEQALYVLAQLVYCPTTADNSRLRLKQIP